MDDQKYFLNNANAYQLAQNALADLKSEILLILNSAPEGGIRNADIGRTLGIYHGHVGHEGHIPRAILALMENEGTVEQDPETKLWRLKSAGRTDADEKD